jgi:RNA polymerase-binding transcription factor DksA
LKKTEKTKKETTKKEPTPPPVVKSHVKVVPPPTYGRQDDIDFQDVHDEGDIASAIEMGFIAQALSRHKEKVAPEQHPDFDGENCLECGNEIPMVRLEMGKIRCVHCQEALELRNKMFGKK